MRTTAALIAALLAGCAAAPAETFTPATPLVASSGLVIGTVSYRYVELEPAADPVAHFERIDTPAPQDYELPVSIDPDTRSGMFDGTLPAGVYAFREVASAGRSYPAGAMPMPFEVTAGAVRDAGHYALSPLAAP